VRAYLIKLTLRYPAEHYERALKKLLRRLPHFTKRVWHDEQRSITILTMNADSPDVLKEKLADEELSQFVAVNIVQLGILSASTDGSIDPFETWMRQNVRVINGGKRHQSDNVPPSKRREVGR
jgi:hypothetical protein